MSHIAVSTHIAASRDQVWEEVANLENHIEWIADAHAIEFLTEMHSGVGTRMEVETRFGSFRTTDVMEITAWDEGERMAATHQGRFTGQGAFTLEPEDGGTRCSWTEEIRFPWFFGGPIGAWAARPIFSWVWRHNLRRLRSGFSAR